MTTTDSIPPAITRPAIDLTLSCELAIEDSLSAWFNRFASIDATDSESPISLATTITAVEALSRLDADQSIECGTTGSVTVGFYAIDTCNNVSDTSFANFAVIDTLGPLFTTLPSDLTVICNASREDSLNSWISTFGGALINDDCSTNESFVQYVWSDSEGNMGTGDYNIAPNVSIDLSQCSYIIDVTFVAQDECGNRSSATASFSLIDTIAPVFESTLPESVVVNCDNIPSARNINVEDNCIGTIVPTITDISTQNADPMTCEYYNYRVDRTYTATDFCGNSASIQQVIFVADTIEPRFVAPRDTTIFDIANPTPDMTGTPLDVIDNCSSQTLVDYTDNVSVEGCVVTIDRRWQIQDLCGSSLVLSQNITVIDSIAPIVVSPVINIILDCSTDIDIASGFEEWTASFGSSVVTDEISTILQSFAAVPGSYDLDDEDTWPGENPGELDTNDCPSGVEGFVRFEEVDFVFIDGCGNHLILTGTYGLRDNQAPTISTDRPDETIYVDEDLDCQARYSLTPIQADDNCAGGEPASYASGNVTITAESSEVPVNNVALRIGPISIGSLNTTDLIELIINLNTVDANNPTEFFNIRAESGEIIGRTNNSTAQCGSVSTSLFVDNESIIEWISDDGFIDLTLEANIVTNVPTLSINTVCQSSSASARLNIESASEYSVQRSVRINDGPYITLEQTIDTVLNIGENIIIYRASDCAENADSLIQTIMVLDTLAGMINCPSDTTISLAPGMCMADVTIPTSISTNENSCSGSRSVVAISVTGATIIETEDINLNNPTATLTLEKGTSVVRYTLEDVQGAQSSCSYRILIDDDEFPQLECNDRATVQLHPSGILPLIIDTSALLVSATDNCEIVSIEIEGGENVSCASLNQEITLILRATDASGNVSQCNVTSRILAYELNPIAEPVLCFGDTIRLFANAPEVDQANIYSYRWMGPNGYISTSENPIIPNASAALSGVYNLELTGANGCVTTGSVEVFIQDFTSPDILLSSSSFCLGEEVTLSSFSYPSPVDYLWYEGVFPDGQLLARTDIASLAFMPELGGHNYYLIIETDICDTDFAPSDPVAITILDAPVVSSLDSIITVCNGETIQLTATTEETDLIFQWIGPNGFSSDQLIPDPIENTTIELSGVYQLVSSRQNCMDTLEITVEIINQLSKPIIEALPSYCEGQDFTLSISNYDSMDQLEYRWILNNALFTTTLSDSVNVFNADSIHVGEWRVIAMDSLCNSDTSDIVNITIIDNLSIDISSNSPVCESDSIQLSIPFIEGATYEWTGPAGFASTLQNPTAAPFRGTYSVVVSTSSGCSNVFSTQIVVEDIPRILTIFSDIEECTDGTNSTLLNTSTFPDDNISYAWSGPNGYASIDERAIIRNYTEADNGYYTLVVSRNGCSSLPDSILFEVMDLPMRPSISGATQSCVGDSMRLNITSPEDNVTLYNWTTPNGVIGTTDPYLDLTNITQNDAGQYFVRAVTNGCPSRMSDTLSLSVFRIPTPPTISANVPLCIGEELILEVALENNTTYEWVGPNGFSSAENRVVISDLSSVDDGSYGVRIYRNGCPSEFAFVSDIEFLEIPSAPVIETTDQDVCQEQSQALELCIDRSGFVAGIEYTWINTTNGAVLGVTNDVCLKLETFIGLNPGVNNLIARSRINGCLSDDSAPIIVEVFGFPDVTAQAGDDISVCTTENIMISAIEPLRGTGRWSSADPNVTFTNVDAFETFVFGLREGENVLTWSLSNGPCTDFSTDQKIIIVEEEVVAEDDLFTVEYNSSADFEILANDQIPSEYDVTITDEPRSGTAEYNDMSNIITYTGLPSFVGTVSFTYEVCSVFCPDQCDVGVVTIEVGNASECFAPTIITPNGDGMNDAFVIPCIESGLYNNNELFVYNQWGDEVYTAQTYANDWQGTFNGSDLPTGTYYYIFKPNPQTEPIKGFLILER